MEASSVCMLVNKRLKQTLVMMDQLPASEGPFKFLRLFPTVLCKCILISTNFEGSLCDLSFYMLTRHLVKLSLFPFK